MAKLTRIAHNIFTKPLRFLERRRIARKFVRKVIHLLDKGMQGFEQEADETQKMAKAFFKMLEHKLNLNSRSTPPTEEEVKAAIEQLKDVGRVSLFATVSILPGGGISLIGLELLARKFGFKKFTLIPSSFRKGNREKSHSKKKKHKP